MKYKTVNENKDGTFSFEGSKARYTPEEFEKIKLLMPDTGWLIFAQLRPEQITNPSYVPCNDDEN